MWRMLQDTASKIRRIICKEFQVSEDRIRPESSLIDDLGADSLRLVGMILAFEETFDIHIEDEDPAKIITVRDAIDYVEKRVAAKHPE